MLMLQGDRVVARFMSVLEDLRQLCSSSAYSKAVFDPSIYDNVLGSVARAFVLEDEVGDHPSSASAHVSSFTLAFCFSGRRR